MKRSERAESARSGRMRCLALSPPAQAQGQGRRSAERGRARRGRAAEYRRGHPGHRCCYHRQVRQLPRQRRQGQSQPDLLDSHHSGRLGRSHQAHGPPERSDAGAGRSQVHLKYLSNSHGLAPEEAKPVMYMAEHRIQDEVIPNESVRVTCNNCHALGRVFQWHRPREEWSLLADMHSALYHQAEAAFPPQRCGGGGARRCGRRGAAAEVAEGGAAAAAAAAATAAAAADRIARYHARFSRQELPAPYARMGRLAGAHARSANHRTVAYLGAHSGTRQILRRTDDRAGRRARRVHHHREAAAGERRTGDHPHRHRLWSTRATPGAADRTARTVAGECRARRSRTARCAKRCGSRPIRPRPKAAGSGASIRSSAWM